MKGLSIQRKNLEGSFRLSFAFVRAMGVFMGRGSAASG
jgi:hypothetical protein